MKKQVWKLQYFLLTTIFLFSMLSAKAQEANASPDIVTIRVMTQPNELSPESIAAFEAENPDIHVELISTDSFTYDLMLATDQPDLLRVGSTELPAMVANGLFLDLNPYFEASEIIAIDDLTPATNYFRVDGHYYGLPKDWSPDFSIYIYTPAFEAAGLSLPSTNEPLTYAELAEIAAQLTIRDGDTVVMSGLNIPNIHQIITLILLQNGASMFNEDNSELQLTENPFAMEVVRFFFDMTLAGDLNYDWSYMGNAWGGGTIPMFLWGYWYGGTISQDNPMYEELMMLPAPTWDRSLPRINPTGGPVGMSILASTAHPDEAYRFFEWYVAGGEAIRRTSNGWGVPSLSSMIDLLPQDTEFNQQRYEVLINELPYSDWTLPTYPHQTTVGTFLSSWQSNIARAMAGEIDFETFVSNLQEEVNLAILNEELSGQ